MNTQLVTAEKNGHSVINVEKTMDQFNSIIEMAISGNADIDKLQQLMNIKQQYEAAEARKDFNLSMSVFKLNPPVIEKDMHVKFKTSKGVTEYHHASLANVCNTIGKALAQQQLFINWKVDQAGGLITVTCNVTHANGHFESTSMSASPDSTGGKNNIQAIASTVSYLERYTVLAITGLSTSDMDNDGRTIEQAPGNEQQMNQNQHNNNGLDLSGLSGGHDLNKYVNLVNEAMKFHPEIYNKMVGHFNGVPSDLESYKSANAFINSEIDKAVNAEQNKPEKDNEEQASQTKPTMVNGQPIYNDAEIHY
jgi:hypothetical protein